MSDLKDPFRRAEELLNNEKEKQAAEAAKAQLKGRFEAGEHQWLGMRGATDACAQLGLDPGVLRRLRRRAGDVELSYGEIVALSGDFYGSPQALFDEEPSPLPWLYESNDLSDLRDRFAVELNWIMDENRPRDAGYPDNNVAFAWNAKSYLELAKDNNPHFGWHNAVAYCQHHGAALDLAMKAQSTAPDDQTWMRAVYYNGFADHFLTDGFAAGHIRVPRAQIREWAKGRDYGESLAGLLSKVLHDQDGHVDSLHAQGEQLPDSEGLPVRNSLNVDWSTRCDGQLFLVPGNQQKPLITEPVAAVKASLLELFQAQKDKRVPTGVFEALKHVPFPRPGAQTLTDKFHGLPPERITRLLKACRWYTRIPHVGAMLDEEKITTLFTALPELMAAFRAAVAKAWDESDELRRRLPAPYVEAFKTIA